MKPFIGINLDISAGPPPEAKIQTTYVDAIKKAGGLPILLAPMSDEDLKEVLTRLNGIMLIGGLDYCPSTYGEERHPLVEVTDPVRHDFDFRLIDTTLKNTDLPILGICAGAQLLNITLGGSLIQDIKSEKPDSHVEHSSRNGWNDGFTKHEVKIDSNSYLGKIYKSEKLAVPTSHHQAVKRVGKGLKVVAHAEDGIIEAVELPDRPFTLGVQWHPERDFDSNKALFEEFVQQSRKLCRA